MNMHTCYIQHRKYHFENMMHGYGMEHAYEVPLKIARMYYGIATQRAESYFAREVSVLDREWAEMTAGRAVTVKKILEIRSDLDDREAA